jgi:hypothetical protein
MSPSIPFDELRELKSIRALSPESARLRDFAYAVMNQTLRGARYQVNGVALRALSSVTDDSPVTPVTIYSHQLDVGNLIEIAVDAEKLADALKTSAAEAEAWLTHLQTEIAHWAEPKTSLKYPRVGIRNEKELAEALAAWERFVAERRWPVTTAESSPLLEAEGSAGTREASADQELVPTVAGDERRENSDRRDGLEATRIEKAAADAGFDRTVENDGDWLVFRSTAFPTSVGISAQGGGGYRVAISDAAVGQRLGREFALPISRGPKPWAISFAVVDGYELLYKTFQRAARVARVLAGEGLREFQVRTRTPPDSTEAVRLVVQRVGQDIFRSSLIEYWNGKCAVTGLDVLGLLRASHIKRWADCESDTERLDVFNGLLLSPHLDALFDKGWVTFVAGSLIPHKSGVVKRRRRVGAGGAVNGTRAARVGPRCAGGRGSIRTTDRRTAARPA